MGGVWYFDVLIFGKKLVRQFWRERGGGGAHILTFGRSYFL